MEELARKIKTLVYVIGMIALFSSTCSAKNNNINKYRSEFFPPDIVPHPHPPYDPPEDGGWA
jgi:hypothetical protein